MMGSKWIWRGAVGGVLWMGMQSTPVLASAGIDAYQDKRYQQAFTLLANEAHDGGGEVQYLLATLYIDGLGVPPSSKQGVIWLERAIGQRHAAAAQLLGKLYLSGMGVPMDVDKGVYYLQLADQFTPKEEQEECE